MLLRLAVALGEDRRRRERTATLELLVDLGGVVDEMEAARKALDRSRPGDLVVLCVDYATEVFKELESRRSLAAPTIFASTGGNGQVEGPGGDPDVLGA